MIVLDYIRSTVDETIVVPPFHTGHLGFVPGTEVSVGLMAPFTNEATHCEMVISPFHHNIDQMARISCTMKDAIGVVGKLVNAVSELGCNIATQESSAINHLNHHTVNLLFDLSTSSIRNEPTKDSVLRLYSKYESLFPLHDGRYVTIFEHIVAHCADVIVWKDVLGRWLPEIHIAPLTNTVLNRPSPATITSSKKVGGKQSIFHVNIDIPPAIDKMIRKYLRQPDTTSPLQYILLSDTDERNLRVFFPTPEITKSLIHIGFHHDDLPGVLSEIIDSVALSRFNILTSLLRKVTAEVNVWEAVLQYKGDKDMPGIKTGEEICSWVADLITSNSRNLKGLIDSNVKIGLPLYPKREGAWTGKHSIANRSEITGPGIKAELSLSQMLEERFEAARHLDPADSKRVTELLSLVQRNVNKGSKPTIFLSYPRNARLHADLIKNDLKERYNFSEYQESDGENILSEVRKRLLDSDYFIGIWHHDENLPTTNGKFNISPWMPFEYGIAFTADKRSIVIHSDKLDENVWKRINPVINNPEYSDIFFESKTLKTIFTHCEKYFK